MVTVLLLPGRELWLGFDPSSRRLRHDERKCDEIVNSLRNELPHSSVLLFVRTGISIQQYSSTKARNDGDFRVERDTFLSEYHRHDDCSAIRLVTPAGSNMLCAVSTVEERQACPIAEFGFCIGALLA